MSAAPLTLRFDSGTLVLDGLAQDAAVEAIPPGCLWDARVSRFRAPAFRYREIFTFLTRAAERGLAFRDEARQYATLTLTHRAARAPFAHQAEAMAQWAAAGKRGVVVLHPGSGKSYVAELALLA